MICSMTAFARCEKKYEWGNISWEIRSLNQRYLDIYVDIPKYIYGLSWEIRKRIKHCLIRGKIECCLYIVMNNTISEFNVNEQLVHHIIASVNWIKTHIDEGIINLISVLSWPGVVTYKQNDIVNINLYLLECFEETLRYLIQDREREGLFLKERIIERLCCMNKEVENMRGYIPDVLILKRNKLLERMRDISICVDNNVRLEQELLMIAQKIDISEEIDRLVSHIKESYNVLSQRGPVGRRLDFISQELYREVNTISAKSINFNITQSAIALKVLIEQMREQVQNIE